MSEPVTMLVDVSDLPAPAVSWIAVVEQAQERVKARRLLVTLNDGADSKTKLTDVAGVVTALSFMTDFNPQGSVRANVEVIDTPMGRVLDQLLDAATDLLPTIRMGIGRESIVRFSVAPRNLR